MMQNNIPAKDRCSPRTGVCLIVPCNSPLAVEECERALAIHFFPSDR